MSAEAGDQPTPRKRRAYRGTDRSRAGERLRANIKRVEAAIQQVEAAQRTGNQQSLDIAWDKFLKALHVASQWRNG